MKANKFEKLQEFEILNIGMMDAVQGGDCSGKYPGDSCGDGSCWGVVPENNIPILRNVGHDGICTEKDAPCFADWFGKNKGSGSGGYIALPKDNSIIQWNPPCPRDTIIRHIEP